MKSSESGNLLEEIEKRLLLNRYISLYTKVDGRGWADCPLHKETKPSLKIYDNQSWYCFGCHKGGDLIAFVMEMENLTFREALKKLAHDAGLNPKDYQPKTTGFNKAKEYIRLSHKVKVWEDILNQTTDMVITGCSLLNDEFRLLTHTPQESIDHKTYTAIHINSQRFEEYNEQADIVLDKIKKQLDKYKDELRELKRSKSI
jgi:hypothetical protein